MPTIKRKVEMNLPQLIEWGIKNEITSKEYTCNNKDGYKSVIFSTTGTVHLNSFQTYLADDKYKVEVEEEITEDTKLGLVERFIGGMGNVCYTSHRLTIKECLKRNPRDYTTTHFYIENDNRDLVLIWRDGKLLE